MSTPYKVYWSFIDKDHVKTLTIMDTWGTNIAISSAHPNFNELYSYLESGGEDPEEIDKLAKFAKHYLGESLTFRDDQFFVDDVPLSVDRVLMLSSLSAIMEKTKEV